MQKKLLVQEEEGTHQEWANDKMWRKRDHGQDIITTSTKSQWSRVKLELTHPSATTNYQFMSLNAPLPPFEIFLCKPSILLTPLQPSICYKCYQQDYSP
jgi:hypothetical protein